MVYFLNSFIAFIVVAVVDSRSVPLKIPHPTQSASSSLVLVDIPPTQQQQLNLEGNVIHSEEKANNNNVVVFESYANGELIGDKFTKHMSKADKENALSLKTNAKNKKNEFSDESDSLSKFYLNGQRSVSTSADAIVFPTAQVHFESKILDDNNDGNISARKGQDQSNSNHRYSNIKMPFDYSTHAEFQPQPDILPLFAPEQEQLTYDLLVQLLRSILRRSKIQENEPLTSTTETINLSSQGGGVDFQSLYSGPRFQKSPCPEGQHRAHNGLCQDVSRKLTRG